MAKPEMIKVKALKVFTKTTEFGNFHGDPNSHTERGKKPLLPASIIPELVDRGCIELLSGKGEKAPAKDKAPAETKAPAARLPQLDHDNDGKPGGSLPADPPALSGKKRAELFQIARDEEVSVQATMKNAELIKAIEDARAAKADDEDVAP